MSKIKLKIAERNDKLLYMTRVENIFINEFLPDAPGEYVKLFLLALFYSQYEEETNNRSLAMILGMTEEEIEEAWEYWAAKGLVTKNADGSVIEFNRMLEKFYGKNTLSLDLDTPSEEYDDDLDEEDVDTFYDFDSDEEDAEARLIDQQLQQLFARYEEVVGRTTSRKELEKLEDALKVYGIKAEVLFYAIDYCADIGKDNADYIFKVALRWKEDGCEDISSVKKLLEKHNARNSAYREVFKALGFNRIPNPGDREIMDPWFDEMGFSLDEVLDACKASAGIREPSLRYVNKVLENKMLEKGGVKVPFSRGEEKPATKAASENDGVKVSRKVLRDYYEYIREEDENAYKARLNEAAENIPGMKEVLDRERELGTTLVGLNPSGSGRKSREALRNERKSLEERKRIILEDEGLPPDYLERKYRCNICRDTGYTDEGKVCTCCRTRADEAYNWYRKKSEA